jgi:hypothetical protein
MAEVFLHYHQELKQLLNYFRLQKFAINRLFLLPQFSVFLKDLIQIRPLYKLLIVRNIPRNHHLYR